MKNKNLIRNIISIITIIMMIMSSLSSVVLTADAEERDIIKSGEYSVNVYVPKNTVGNIEFYPTLDFDEENRDVFNENDVLLYKLDSETDTQYDIYSMSVKEGIYSFRATDNDGKSLGGGVIKVPAEKNADSSEKESSEVNAYLRLSKTYITNKYDDKKACDEDFSVTLFNQLGIVTMGDAFVDEKGYSCYPALIYVNGNALLYYVTATPSEEYARRHQLKEERNSNIAVFKSDKIHSFKLTLTKKHPFTITAPAGADVSMYNQILNFKTIKEEPLSITKNNNGTCNYFFDSAGESYRVSMEGKRTQAGYISPDIGTGETTLNVTFPEGENGGQSDAWSGRKESSVLLNINERNKLSLDVGESYKVRAYRAAWQIINTDTDNIMIEPDFRFNILSGRDVIDIRQTDGGNAGGNWAEITAKNTGVAIVEVSYEAIDVAWSNKVELYGATNPRRTGVFAVVVGDGYGDISGIDIDAEYYTHYFTEENGVLTVVPEGDRVSVEVANVWQGTLHAWKNIMGNYGAFDVPIANGNNVLKITADGITDYRIIRGSRIETVITNKTNAERTEAVCPGDKLTISFKGLFQWIPKFSGIYNPSRLYAIYHQGETIIESEKSQYALPETTMNITVPVDAQDKLVLNRGRLSGNSLGSKWSAHRQLTDNGVPTNFYASNLLLTDIPLPDLIIPVAELSDNSDNKGNSYHDSSIGSGDFYEPEKDGIGVSGLKFDISGNQIKGYVTLSLTDDGKRRSDESGIKYKAPLGKIIEPVEVPFEADDTVASVTLRLLKALDIKAIYTGKPTNNFYLSSIGNFTLNGKYYSSFGEFDAGAASGWMVRYNDWFINMGASEFEVKDGDVVEWLYTCRLGEDVGCDWVNPSAEIVGIKFKSNYGTLSPSFAKDVEEYTYTVPSSTKSICLSAERENYWARVIYKSEGKSYKAMEPIPVSDGTVITVENVFTEYMGHTPTDTDSLKIVVRKNGGHSGSGAENSFNNDNFNIDKIVADTASYLHKTVREPQVGSVGGEWTVLGLARSGIEIPDEYYRDYYENVEEYVKERRGILHDKKYTEYSRLILALTAIGKNPRDVAGYNLLTPLGDYEKTIWQGMNGPIWALIALDSGNYDMPKNKEAKIQATREMYVEKILDCQLPDGGWSLFGGTAMSGAGDNISDADITGMALQALSKYQDNERVKKAIDTALDTMNQNQDDKGGFSGWGTANSESCVQMLVALCELGIPIDDARFVKNGYTILNNLMSYYNDGKGFIHTKGGGGSNLMATEQAFYGIVAVKRARDGKNSLYRMNDTISFAEKTEEIIGLKEKNADVKKMDVISPGKTFVDITGHKEKILIEALASRGIVNGKTENSFEPDSTMSRAEFATIIARGLGLPGKDSAIFKDVTPDDWFYSYVGTAYSYSIIKGVAENEFNPKGTITREQAAVMIQRAARLCGMDTEMDTLAARDVLAQFSDYVKVSDWAQASLAFCYDKGILSDDVMDIYPKESVTRAEIAAMLYNMLSLARLI